MTTYTPGKWVIHPHRNKRWGATGEPVPWFIVPESHADRPIGGAEDEAYDREHFAQEVCTLSGSYRHRPDSEVWANARLIAASPGLLEALKELLAYCKDDNPGGFSADAHLAGLAERAEKAIASSSGGKA